MNESEFFEYDTVLNVLADHSQGSTPELDAAICSIWDDLKKKTVTGQLLLMPVPGTPHATLPLGRLVYQHDGSYIYTNVIRKVIYDTSGPAFDNSAIGKSVFLTREAAEADMKGGCG